MRGAHFFYTASALASVLRHEEGWGITYFCTFVLHTTVKKEGGLRYERPPACYFHYD